MFEELQVNDEMEGILTDYKVKVDKELLKTVITVLVVGLITGFLLGCMFVSTLYNL